MTGLSRENYIRDYLRKADTLRTQIQREEIGVKKEDQVGKQSEDPGKRIEKEQHHELRELPRMEIRGAREDGK